jgi:thiamine kinase-like enzyme
VQSTTKTTRSKVVHQWSALQEEFLATLHEKTKQTILFEKSDYYRTLTALQEHLDWLPGTADRVVIETTIAGVQEKYRGKEVEYSACHGDFTPWNMFVEKNELFVFDFEYAALTYPAGLDRYHFELQTANFEKKMTAEEQISYLQSCEWVEREKLIMYLLDIMSRFTIREKGEVKGDVANSFTIWNKILTTFTKLEV